MHFHIRPTLSSMRVHTKWVHTFYCGVWGATKYQDATNNKGFILKSSDGDSGLKTIRICNRFFWALHWRNREKKSIYLLNHHQRNQIPSMLKAFIKEVCVIACNITQHVLYSSLFSYITIVEIDRWVIKTEAIAFSLSQPALYFSERLELDYDWGNRRMWRLFPRAFDVTLISGAVSEGKFSLSKTKALSERFAPHSLCCFTEKRHCSARHWIPCKYCTIFQI